MAKLFSKASQSNCNYSPGGQAIAWLPIPFKKGVKNVVFKAIHNSKVTKIIIILLIASCLFMTIEWNQPKKVDAFALTAGAAFAALVGIALTAIAGYSIVQEWQPTFGTLNDIYDNVMNKLNESDRADFIAALGVFGLTGIITENLINQLKIGLIGNEVINHVKTKYTDISSSFPVEAYTMLAQTMDSYTSRPIHERVYLNTNDRYLILLQFSPYSESYTEYYDFVEVKSITTDQIRQKVYSTIQINKINSIGTNWGTMYMYFHIAVYDVVNQTIVESPENQTTTSQRRSINTYMYNTTPVGLIDIAIEFPATSPTATYIPDYNYLPTIPGIQDLDITQVPPIAVPVDTAIDIPAFPTDPAIDTPITIPIPGVATGDNVIDVPLDPAGTVDEPLDPAIPGTGIGTLAPTMPTDVTLDFSPLMDIGLSNKFPFSIPFDIVGILSVFSGTSRTPPEFSLPFVQDITLDFDMSDFEPVAMMTRVFFLILFIIALAFATKRMLF